MTPCHTFHNSTYSDRLTDLQHGGLHYIPHSAVPVSERSDHQSVRVAQILVAELKLGIADVHVAVSAFVVPAMPQLRQPRKGLTVCHLQGHKHLERQAAYSSHTTPASPPTF